MSDMPDRDSLEELLGPPAPADAALLRRGVLVTTLGQQRRRRGLRRGALVSGLAACFLAGMVTMWLLASAAPPVTVVVQDTSPNAAQAPPPRTHDPGPKPDVDRPTNAGQAAALLAAGDRCLNDAGDPEAALRCYRRALDAASREESRFSADDNWLLMAIKNAREKEARHANHDS